jgi:hypothetical protein
MGPICEIKAEHSINDKFIKHKHALMHKIIVGGCREAAIGTKLEEDNDARRRMAEKVQFPPVCKLNTIQQLL